jgi:hypothetical protein
MRLFPSLVPVSDVTCNIPGRFSAESLRQAAQLILSGDGIITPLIVRQTSFDHYELVDGAFEYYAAMEAKKLDPLRGELINAYIVPSAQEQIIAEQIAVFRRGETLDSVSAPSVTSTDANAELLRQFALMRKELQDLETRFTQTQSAAGGDPQAEPAAASTPVAVKHESKKRKEAVVATPAKQPVAPETPAAAPKATTEEAAFIDFLNRATTQDIQNLDSRVQHKAIDLLLNQRNRRLFDSQEDCLSRVRGKGFADASYVRILGKWREKHGSASAAKQASLPIDSTAAAKKSSKRRVKVKVATPATTSRKKQRSATDKAATSTSKTPEASIDKLNNMDKRELALTLNRLRISKKLIEAVLENRPFTSFEAIDIPGLGTSKREKIKSAFA